MSLSLIKFFPSLKPLQLSPEFHQKISSQIPLSPPPSPSICLTTASSPLLPLVCPSFARANLFFFNSSFQVQVSVDENEPEEKLIGRFRREVLKAGVLQECKRRRWFESNQDKRKRKSRNAARRLSKRYSRPKVFMKEREERSEKKKSGYDSGEDNWEFYNHVQQLPYC